MDNLSIPTLSIGNILGEDPLGISLFRHSVKGRNEFEQPHKHDFYLVFFVDSGSGLHDIDFMQYKVSDNQIYFIRPGQLHNWSLKEGTSGFQLMLSEEVIQVFSNLSPFPFFQLASPSCLSLHTKEFDEYRKQLQEIEKLLPYKDLLTKEIVVLRLHLLLKLLQKDYVAHFPDNEVIVRPEKIVQKFIDLIEIHFHEESSVRFYAQQLNITPNYLNILSQKYLKTAAGDFIKDRIMLEAKRLLISTSLSMKEIAYQLGFNDNGYFSKAFRKHTGKAPSDFRESYNFYHSSH
ncbi:helix-turn-helix domain-containing protein [Flavobacterium granuli]|uniref:AraC-like ligand binding domain-containing protein n=1 Tax=Flavobacterium granuli TaxID=280093 RepID=A0A1M5M4C6_9FLAO|nr:helix-turn-helix domain-containing protein [Flavobacterium granuli]PRZ24206.1 AraC-like protein [Flavobacterium granuli]SHG72090.1 AraC-like ligand binding domain-containing protein [Flavobacterium granuli]